MKNFVLILSLFTSFHCMVPKDSLLDPNGDLSLLRLLYLLTQKRPAQPTVFLHAQVMDSSSYTTTENFLAAFNPETNEFRYRTPNFLSLTISTSPTDNMFNIPMVADPIRSVVYLYLSHEQSSGGIFQHRILKLDLKTGSILGEVFLPTKPEEVLGGASINGIAYDPISDSIFFGTLGAAYSPNNFMYEVDAENLSLKNIHNIPKPVTTYNATRGGLVYHSENSTIDYFWFDSDVGTDLYVNPFRVGYEISATTTSKVISAISSTSSTSSVIPIYIPSEKRYVALDKTNLSSFELYSFNRENYTGTSITANISGSYSDNTAQTVYHTSRNSLFTFIDNTFTNPTGIEISLANGAEGLTVNPGSSSGSVAIGSHYIHSSSNRLYFVRQDHPPLPPRTCVNGVLDLSTNVNSYSPPFHTVEDPNICKVKWVNYAE